MATYHTVLKQVAEGLTLENVDTISYYLGFSAAKRSSLTNGIKLLDEMKKQYMFSEDNLCQLRCVLENHNLTKLSKVVGEFMEMKNQGLMGVSDDTKLVEADARPVQRTQVSTPVQPESELYGAKTTAPLITTQPVSAINYDANVSAHDRWKQESFLVSSFQSGGYELKIIANTTKPAHYETSEGLRVVLPWGSEYKIYIRNNKSHRCFTEVTYDGNWAGEFELRPSESMTIEGPIIDKKKFCFVKPESANPAFGLNRDNADNGIISATFNPEKLSYMNDSKRGGIREGHLEMDDLALDGLVVADAMPFTTEGQSFPVVGGGPSSDWCSGATALVGQSNQQFQLADDFKVDESRKVKIQLKLVGV